MALAHEILYNSNDLTRVDIAEYVYCLVDYLFSDHGISKETITLHIRIDDISLRLETAVPFGLILNEMVSNALKYAFPAGSTSGIIRIELCFGEGDQLRFLVSDNGRGLPSNLDFRNAQTLGLQLIDILTQQLKGTIELDRSAGTAFTISFANKNG